MSQELTIILKGKDKCKFRHIKRTYPVSNYFLNRNFWNIKRFLIYALNPHCVIRRYAWRKRNNRVVIIQRVRLLLFDPRLKRMIKKRKQNVKCWSQRVVKYYKAMGQIKEYEETEIYDVVQPEYCPLGTGDLSKQMKEQLELLKSSKRGLLLIEDANKNVQLKEDSAEEEPKKEEAGPKIVIPEVEVQQLEDEAIEPMETESELAVACTDAAMEIANDCPFEPSPSKDSNQTNTSTPDKGAGGSKFLDMLISKVRVKNFAKESNFLSVPNIETPSALESPVPITTEDSGDDFLGFDESSHQPGMLLTPLVPQNCKTRAGNAAFVSDSLEEYMRKNNISKTPATPLRFKADKDWLLEPKARDGLVTQGSTPPHMDMPAVPESLQKLRTVAERRQYLQRFSKNHKMAIINNEANIYRELQRKQRNLKVKSASMLMLQGPHTQMPFTRAGWQAASYVGTEHNRYYYQVINVDGEDIKLPGALGNNARREKRPYRSKLTNEEASTLRCGSLCLDAAIWRDLKIIKTKERKAKLNQYPLPAIFRPCPLSQKPFQKPLDDDTAALLLAGGSMAVVSMPTVELEVKPQLGRQLDEIAKRYLQYILPHHDITREWAEFSVSTLQQSSTVRDAEAHAAKTPDGRRKSFTFVIPYLNDRNHILVRRVVDRSEQLDASFTESEEKLLQFDFRRAMSSEPTSDELACAEMISDMINTVAISCSENSFITEDPDGLDVLPAGMETSLKDEDDAKTFAKPKMCKTTGRPPYSKQHRLRLELRRLNATIIDTASKSNSTKKPCCKDYCQLGCVCESLVGELPLREHCGRADCVLECSCKGAELTRVMRVETDGRGISNEDAFNLRRKATARLAKMEKEFTSTLVLTENETLLINESQCDKKRRCTKAPKRYEDFAETEDDSHVRITPPKRDNKSETVKRSVVNIESTSASQPHSQSTSYAHVSALTEPCKVKDTDMENMKHCFVSLRRLSDVSNLATFCMTHELYKCFCGAESVEGKPMVIEKEPENTTIAHFAPEIATRAHYSFERMAEEQPSTSSKTKSRKEHKEGRQTTAAPAAAPAKEAAKVQLWPQPDVNRMPTRRQPELEILSNYFKARPDLSRRTVVVPRNCYMRLNREAAPIVLQQIARQENANTEHLLNQRVNGAVRFYRAELDQQRRLEMQYEVHKQRELELPSPIIEVRDDSDDGREQKQPNTASSSSSSRKRSSTGSSKEKVRRRSHEVGNAKRIKLINEPLSKDDADFDALPEMSSQNSASAASELVDIQVPRISACYSLNSASSAAASSNSSNIELIGSDMQLPVDMVSNDGSASGSSIMGQDSNFRSFYEVVKNMNALVSKKMQDIDMALQRESKIIPTPNEEILCIIKWTNFLAAFESDLVFIWDVKMKNYNFLAATTTNMMPSVCGALGVVNIFALEQRQLPLMARMLIQRKRNENTRRLAVVMQGRQQYWLVKGFLRHMAGNACTKPTPQTHPLLTKKINVLCTLMVKQRMREHQRKQLATSGSESHDMPSEAPTSILSPPPAPATAVPSVPLPSQSAASQQVPQTSPSPTARPTVVLPSQLPSTSASSTTATLSTSAPTSVSGISKDKDVASNIRTNIEFRKVLPADVDELQLPELLSRDHRWVVLDLFDDFSHIFVPAFKDMISLDRIHNVIRVAAEKVKVVKLQFFQSAPYDAFVTPTSQRKIYFGPLRTDMPPPVLVLLQSVDGKMMLREVYQRLHGIPVQPNRRTMAFWVLYIKGQVHFEIDMESAPQWEYQKQTQPEADNFANKQVSHCDDTEDDDDCVIIDDDDDEKEETKEELTDKNEGHPNAAAKPTEQLVQQIVDPTVLRPQRISFTIQTNNSNGNLQITPQALDSNAQSITAAGTMALQSKDLSGGFMPFISSVPAKITTNPVAPIAQTSVPQFITPHVQLTQTASPPATTTIGALPLGTAQPPPPKISRISVHTAHKINTSLQQLLGPKNITPSVKLGGANTGITITKISHRNTNPKEGLANLATESSLNSVGQAGAVIGPAATATKRTATGIPKPSSSPVMNSSTSEPLTIKTIAITAAPNRSASAVSKLSNPLTKATILSGPTIAKEVSTTINRSTVAAPKVDRKSLPANLRALNTTPNEQPRRSEPKKSQTENNSAAVSSTVSGNTIKSSPAPRRSAPARKILPKISSKSGANSDQPLPPRYTPALSKPERPTYGFLVAEGLPRFRVKLAGTELMLKLPNMGVLTLKDIGAASNFLNSRLVKEEKYKSHLPAKWKFELSSATQKPKPAMPGNSSVGSIKLSSVSEPNKSCAETAILIED
ncbi:uncharacterized protein LOC115624540 [Scaptodrosophila lebanonensis]|uniref:Uncharacterized protein LOC115624540 n=1 Tax=Drosophila lebanonensis TaxID=7225 RepID=A0A6J2TGJ9_DROLE|nr:uncharacterized protein LOC115624540 [Scaptodrosophila lebanonensis]XP_030375123.1 uncharacterized protein LOC115624540 [Scaptodrosophila lebanonensis]XP_030375124.1 uncharacterized protein LOC115624540 [Scaptodrosophila lebanonensis]